MVHIGCLAFAGVVLALLKLPAHSQQVESLVSLGSSVRVGWLRPVLVFVPFRVPALETSEKVVQQLALGLLQAFSFSFMVVPGSKGEGPS